MCDARLANFFTECMIVFFSLQKPLITSLSLFSPLTKYLSQNVSYFFLFSVVFSISLFLYLSLSFSPSYCVTIEVLCSLYNIIYNYVKFLKNTTHIKSKYFIRRYTLYISIKCITLRKVEF